MECKLYKYTQEQEEEEEEEEEQGKKKKKKKKKKVLLPTDVVWVSGWGSHLTNRHLSI
jgi:hypothetical protein